MRKFIAIILVAVTLLCTSCMSTSTSCAGFDSAQGQLYRYDKRKQCYLLWGLIPLGRAQTNTPVDRPFQVRTYLNFGDWCASFFTAGIFCMQTVRVSAKHTADDQIYFKVGDEVIVKKSGKYHKGTIVSIIDGERCTVEYKDTGKIKKVRFSNISK